jgi:hypothetical protein
MLLPEIMDGIYNAHGAHQLKLINHKRQGAEEPPPV